MNALTAGVEQVVYLCNYLCISIYVCQQHISERNTKIRFFRDMAKFLTHKVINQAVWRCCGQHNKTDIAAL